MVAEPPGRRERKKRATYLALRAAALDLVSERGFCNVTVEEIAEAGDVSVRTFFNYFSSKEDALVGDDAQGREAMRAELLALPGEVAPLEALRAVVLGRLRAIAADLDLSGEDHDAWARRFAAVHAQPEVQLAYAKHLTVVEQLVTDALVERMGGEAHRQAAAVVTAAAMAVMRAVMRTTVQRDGEGAIEAVVEGTAAAFDLMASGFHLPTAGPHNHPAGQAGDRHTDSDTDRHTHSDTNTDSDTDSDSDSDTNRDSDSTERAHDEMSEMRAMSQMSLQGEGDGR